MGDNTSIPNGITARYPHFSGFGMGRRAWAEAVGMGKRQHIQVKRSERTPGGLGARHHGAPPLPGKRAGILPVRTETTKRAILG